MFEVQTLMSYGWDNVWHEDDEPQYFETREEAQDEIDDAILSLKEEGMEVDEFRVVEIPVNGELLRMALAWSSLDARGASSDDLTDLARHIVEYLVKERI